MSKTELDVLDDAIAEQRAYVDHWRRPNEVRLFETLRAIDLLHMDVHFPQRRKPSRMGSYENTQAGWGVNQALARMIPDQLPNGFFTLFPSKRQTQAPIDTFLLQCGLLEQAIRLRAWLNEGLLTAQLSKPEKKLSSDIETILVLKTTAPSASLEVVSAAQGKWMARMRQQALRSREEQLAERFKEVRPELERRVNKLGDWGIQYTTSDKVDDFFEECSMAYLQRIWGSDLAGLDDKFGRYDFRSYLGMLAAIGGRSEKHLAMASILKARYPKLDLRNLLTTFAPVFDFQVGLARRLGAYLYDVKMLLEPMTLAPSNRDVHTGSSDMAYAPIVRSSEDFYLLPLYGHDINPFLFLINDLRARYRGDWDRAANNREKRWIDELNSIFTGPRWCIHDRNLKLKRGDAVVTDLDYVVYDAAKRELSIFQLKWQDPVGNNDRMRRSAGKNLIETANRWVETVAKWMEDFGSVELAKRLGIEIDTLAGVNLFVIGRYNALFSGYVERSARATWADWNHFLRCFSSSTDYALSAVGESIRTETAQLLAESKAESYFIPIRSLAIILNPSREPAQG